MRWVAEVDVVAEGGVLFRLCLDAALRSFADAWRPTRDAAMQHAERGYGCRPATAPDDYSSRSK